MDVIVLGAAAGGGFPQWNCHSPASRRARSGDSAARPRTQASVAVSGDGYHWHVFNASPDMRRQIELTPALHPKHGLRSTPIASVVLTGGDVDVIAGLLTLREREPFALHATAAVHAILTANPIFDVLADGIVDRRKVVLDHPTALDDTLTATLFAVPGKVPLYLEDGDGMQPVRVDGTTVGAEITDGMHRTLFIPGCAAMTEELRTRIDGADLVFFDATLWDDDEMIAAGLGAKTGRRMGHMSMNGAQGSIAALADLAIGRRVAIHINNSNPVLLDDSPERATAAAAGWIIAEDGMRFKT
jgi:pyrroloquinoline quinone biosynthesis protein B